MLQSGASQLRWLVSMRMCFIIFQIRDKVNHFKYNLMTLALTKDAGS